MSGVSIGRALLSRWYRRFIDDVASHLASAIPQPRRDVSPPLASGVPALSADALIDRVEWEPLSRPIEIADVTRVGEQHGHFGTATFERGEHYEILARFHCTSAELADSLFRVVPGTLDRGLVMEGVDAHGLTVHVPAFYPFAIKRFVDAMGSRIEISAHVWSLARTHEGLTATTHVDWFISGPTDHSHIMSRRTERIQHRTYERRREGPRDGPSDGVDVRSPGPPAWTRQSGTWDYLMVPAGSRCRAAISTVPRGYGPDWSSCLGIEYRSTWGGLPSEHERDGLVEVLGFLFGRHILRVGSTAHDDEARVTQDRVLQPWGRDVVATSLGPDRPPIPLPRMRNFGSAEALLSPLIERYLSVCDELDLGRALWTVWAADRMPTTFDLPLLSSALERVMNAWFKSTKTKTRGVYLSKPDFDRLLADELNAAAAKLKGLSYGDRMERRLRGAFNMGTNERYEVFFEELQLPIGDGERAAMRGRNPSAHGGGGGGNGEHAVRLGWAYRVLFNRVVLHLLGYQGQYIDYSVLGHPARVLTAPIGYRAVV